MTSGLSLGETACFRPLHAVVTPFLLNHVE